MTAHNRDKLLCEASTMSGQPPCSHEEATSLQGRIHVQLTTARSRSPLKDRLLVVRLYAEKPKFEKAAVRWLERYLEESEPSLQLFARTALGLAELDAARGMVVKRISALPRIRDWAAIEEDEWDGGDQ